jgi:hypothetical protein
LHELVIEENENVALMILPRFAHQARLTAPHISHLAPVLSDMTVICDEVRNLLVLICRVIAGCWARRWKFFSTCD